jgi:hypothetical protein
VIGRIRRGRRQGVDDVTRRWPIGIADAEADDVDAARDRLARPAPDLDVQVRR